MPKTQISILLPAYNESLRIRKCIRDVKRAVSSLSTSYEIIVAEDGSTDGTEKIVAELSKSDSHIRLLHSPVRLGKGKAVKKASRLAKGEVIVFMDVDLATNLDSLPQIVNAARKTDGLAIGSRHVTGARVARPFLRTLFSLSYNLLVRTLFFDGVNDHQCGFKAMTRQVAYIMRDYADSDGLFLDTEIILLCKKLGFRVTEIGVEWSEHKKRNESKIKLFDDTIGMGVELLRFRLSKSSSISKLIAASQD